MSYGNEQVPHHAEIILAKFCEILTMLAINWWSKLWQADFTCSKQPVFLVGKKVQRLHEVTIYLLLWNKSEYVTLPPEMSRTDTQSQYRMWQFLICRSKILIFGFHQKSGASGIFLFKNITFIGQMWCLMTDSGILNGNCCNTVVCKMNFLSQIFHNGTLYGSQIYLSITFEPVGRFA